MGLQNFVQLQTRAQFEWRAELEFRFQLLDRVGLRLRGLDPFQHVRQVQDRVAIVGRKPVEASHDRS